MLSKPKLSAAELREAAGRIKVLRNKATEHAVEIGRELLCVKAALPHGDFVNWVEKGCEFKIRMAQNFMRLARAADLNPELTAVMMPSTLRVYMSNSTPSTVRQLVKRRLEKGERVSRKDLQLAIAETKAKRVQDNDTGTLVAELKRHAKLDLFTAGDTDADSEIDRSRKVAVLLMKRLSTEELEYIMDGMNWGIWNRVLVWLRAQHKTASEAGEVVRASSAAAPAA